MGWRAWSCLHTTEVCKLLFCGALSASWWWGMPWPPPLLPQRAVCVPSLLCPVLHLKWLSESPEPYRCVFITSPACPRLFNLERVDIFLWVLRPIWCVKGTQRIKAAMLLQMPNREAISRHKPLLQGTVCVLRRKFISKNLFWDRVPKCS